MSARGWPAPWLASTKKLPPAKAGKFKYKRDKTLPAAGRGNKRKHPKAVFFTQYF